MSFQVQKKEFSEYPFDLSIARSRYVDGNHKISQRVRSIRLGEFTDQSVRLKIVFPEGDERILRPEDVVTVSEARNGFIIENTIQTGKTVIVEVSEEKELLPVKAPYLQTPPDVGSNFTDSLTLPSVTSTPTLLVPASSNRTMATIIHKGLITWYAGSSAVLSDANFKALAMVINPNDKIFWRNLAGLYIRTESATDANSLYLLDEAK